MSETTIDALVEGGKATPGPPIGPALGPLGVNMMNVINAINEKTKDFEGMNVPVKIIVNDRTKEFRITVGTPPTSSLIKKELGIDRAAKETGTDVVGDLSLEQAMKIVRMKKDSLFGKDMKQNVKTVLGTCVTMGVRSLGKNPREVIDEINKGVHDEKFK